ncbi:MAG: XRE family transcriptional regulator [Planctomycetes bacterium]|nr:XRE family transcriptional regulator [Planctomycetota bacterium]
MAGVAQALGISKRLAQSWRALNILPEPDLHIGRTLRWKPSTIQDWLDRKAGE